MKKTPNYFIKERKSIIDQIYYDLGHQLSPIWLCKQWKNKAGETKSTKWKTYLEAQEDLNFINQVNNRTQLTNEIIFDLDEGSMSALLRSLESEGIKYRAYATSEGRGRHVHTYWTHLMDKSVQERKKFRGALLKHFNADLSYAIDKHMVALEGVPHWKTGKVKEEIKST